MPATLRLALALTCVVALSACPTGRRGGGGGGGGGGEDDDDAASNAEPGLFTWSYSDYEGGYYVGRLLLPLETGFDCGDVDDGGYLEDEDENWIVAYVYRGSDRDWEQDYVHMYEEDCNLYDYDYEDANCYYLFGNIEGAELYGDNDDTFELDDYSSSQVEGSLRLSDEVYDFAVTNCGEYSYDDRSAPEQEAAPEQSSVQTKPAPKPVWKLRFR